VTVLPIRPTHDFLFIDIIDRNVTKKDLGGGKFLHLLSDDSFGQGPHNPMDARHPGVRPRWARVLEVGPEAEDEGVEPGNLVLCEALKWSHGIPLGRDGLKMVNFWRININDIMLVDDLSHGEEYLTEYRALVARLELTIGHL
jgi:hypothetical protein